MAPRFYLAPPNCYLLFGLTRSRHRISSRDQPPFRPPRVLSLSSCSGSRIVLRRQWWRSAVAVEPITKKTMRTKACGITIILLKDASSSGQPITTTLGGSGCLDMLQPPLNVGFAVRGLRDAMTYLHKTYGMCHNDVNPKNILVKESDNWLLTEFDSCLPVGAPSTSGLTKGWRQSDAKTSCPENSWLCLALVEANMRPDLFSDSACQLRRPTFRWLPLARALMFSSVLDRSDTEGSEKDKYDA